jgi:hypothetical protein
MPVDFTFRRKAVRTLSGKIGVYVLADLENIPIYVGQSTDGIRQRVQRHLTSARSDIIANRQIDVWEIAFVWEYPVEDAATMNTVEAALFHYFNQRSRLMNGKIPAKPKKIEASGALRADGEPLSRGQKLEGNRASHVGPLRASGEISQGHVGTSRG